MSLRLHVRPHNSEAEQRLSVDGNERGNNGVERTLPRRIGIRMFRIQVEEFSLHIDVSEKARTLSVISMIVMFKPNIVPVPIL